MTVPIVLTIMWILLIAIFVAYIFDDFKCENAALMMLFAFLTLVIVSIYSNISQSLKSDKLITTDTEVHTVNGVSDTTYIYRKK